MLRFVVAFILAALMLGPAAAHDYSKGGLHIAHPSSRPAAKGMNGVGYLSVHNGGKAADVLLAVESPIAQKVEIHRTTSLGGVSRMSKVTGGVPIPINANVKLEPGGAHVMLIRLKQPLAIGDKVPATLVFRNAGRVPVELLVQRAPARKPEHSKH